MYSFRDTYKNFCGKESCALRGPWLTRINRQHLLDDRFTPNPAKNCRNCNNTNWPRFDDSYSEIVKVRICSCDNCGHIWQSDGLPELCPQSRCTRKTAWNSKVGFMEWEDFKIAAGKRMVQGKKGG